MLQRIWKKSEGSYRRISKNITKLGDKEYEENTSETNTNKKSDPLTEYRDKEPMTPSKINAGAPMAIKRDLGSTSKTFEGQRGTNTEQANEEYRIRGMTKVENDS